MCGHVFVGPISVKLNINEVQLIQPHEPNLQHLESQPEQT